MSTRLLLLACLTAAAQGFTRPSYYKHGLTSRNSNELKSPAARIFVSSRPERGVHLAAVATTTAAVGAATSLVGAQDMWTLWAVASTAAAAGLQLEKNTAVGKALSGPVCAMLFTAVLTNIGVLPASGSVHLTNLQGFVVKLATPLLLLGADLNKIFKETGVLLKAFLVGTLGTLLGSALGFSLFAPSLRALGVDGDSWKIAAALTAKNIGGGINFMSVCGALNVQAATIGAGLAVDNLLGLLYFPLISWLGRNHYGDGAEVGVHQSNISSTSSSSSNSGGVVLDASSEGTDMVESTVTALSVSMVLVALSEVISSKFAIPSVPTVTFLTVALVRRFANAPTFHIKHTDFKNSHLLNSNPHHPSTTCRQRQYRPGFEV